MKIKVLYPYFCLALLLSFFFSCTEKERYKKLDLKNVDPVEIEVHRYEQALFSIDMHHFEKGVAAIAPEFEIFLGDRYDTPQSIIQLTDFISNPIHQESYQACQKKFHNMDWLLRGLSEGFRRYRYFYPESGKITLYTYLSGFNWENPIHFFDNQTLVIGLDNYLGQDFDAYKRLQIPQYIRAQMDAPYIIPHIFHTLIALNFEWNENPELLIDYIIATGKTYYFLNILLPETPKKYQIGYSQEQWRFCEENEDQIWQFFIENNLLFHSNNKSIRSFIMDAPFTSGFPHESPGRIGQWIGWRIVTAYMQNNPEITLQDLMTDCDYKTILQKSGYKPKRQ